MAKRKRNDKFVEICVRGFVLNLRRMGFDDDDINRGIREAIVKFNGSDTLELSDAGTEVYHNLLKNNVMKGG